MSFVITGVPVEQLAVVEVQKLEDPCVGGGCSRPLIPRVEISAENEPGASVDPSQEN